MRKIVLVISLVAIVSFCFLTGKSYALLASTTDLWDISQGTSVGLNSGILAHGYSFDARDMFGGTFGTTEPGNTIFSYDANEAGSLHFIEWQTAAPVTLRSFNLVAAHDDLSYGADARGFSKFTLFAADSSSNWVKLYEYSPANPYGGGVNYTGLNYLELYAGVPETTAQYFRAEFIQYGNTYGSIEGPRIVELDGYSTAVPEPATLSLLGLGLLGLLGLGKRKK